MTKLEYVPWSDDFEEFGVQLPNDYIVWIRSPRPRWAGEIQFNDLHTKTAQESVQKRYSSALEEMGIFFDPKLHTLRFVSRRHISRVTVPVPLTLSTDKETDHGGEEA